MTLISRASSLVDLILSHGLGSRPGVFITHSLGGLLVKQLLRTCGDSVDPKYKALLNNTKGVIFCATPHQGAKLATALDAIFSTLTSAHVKQMKDQCEPLSNLHNWFANWVATNGIAVKAYYETKKTSGVMIVSEGTANPNILGCEPVAIDGDHKSICKSSTHESAIFVSAKALIATTSGGAELRSVSFA
jgi:protein SERAC1